MKAKQRVERDGLAITHAFANAKDSEDIADEDREYSRESREGGDARLKSVIVRRDGLEGETRR